MSEGQGPDSARLWKAAKHLLPFAVIVLALLYWGGAVASEARDREVRAVHQQADERLQAVSRGRLEPPLIDSGRGIERIEERFGVEDEEIPYAVDSDRLAVVLCEAPVVDGNCRAGEARFRVAYPIHRERVGLDTWSVVLAPERDGHFTRDPFRIVYVSQTAGSHYAALISEPVIYPERDDAGVAFLDGFDDSALGEEIDSLADDSGVARLNPLGLSEDEWRLHGDDGSGVPYQDEIYELSRRTVPVALAWLGSNGDLETALTRITLVSATLALFFMICRVIGRFLAYTARGLAPLALFLEDQLKQRD